MGQRGMKQTKSNDRTWLEREQHKGGASSFRGELHTAGAEITCSRTWVHVPIPHQHCHLLLGLLLQFNVSKKHKGLIMRCFWMSW